MSVLLHARFIITQICFTELAYFASQHLMEVAQFGPDSKPFVLEVARIFVSILTTFQVKWHQTRPCPILLFARIMLIHPIRLTVLTTTNTTHLLSNVSVNAEFFWAEHCVVRHGFLFCYQLEQYFATRHALPKFISKQQQTMCKIFAMILVHCHMHYS